MTISRADYAELQAKATCPITEGWDKGTLRVWVPGTPSNPLNGSRGHWSKHSRWAKTWRERAATSLLLQLGVHAISRNGGPSQEWLPFGKPSAPKLITFAIYSAGEYDDDSLPAVAKPCRDALIDMKIIDDDKTGRHAFVYTNLASRRRAHPKGIAMSIQLAKDLSP